MLSSWAGSLAEVGPEQLLHSLPGPKDREFGDPKRTRESSLREKCVKQGPQEGYGPLPGDCSGGGSTGS